MFKLTPKQEEANALLASSAQHCLLAGGSRSGKTALIIRAIAIRALKAPGSRHAVLRFRFGHVKQSIIHDTFPKIMNFCFPEVKYTLNKSDSFAIFPGGSEIWFGGLDDKERTEKILGSEYASIFLNEASQIPYASRNMALTRLAQLVPDSITKKPLALKMYVDENPPSKGHWTYKLFRTKQDPDTKQFLPDPDNYAFCQMNPRDNADNLSADYIKTLESLPLRLRKRFLEGEFGDETPNALFLDETLERWRHYPICCAWLWQWTPQGLRMKIMSIMTRLAYLYVGLVWMVMGMCCRILPSRQDRLHGDELRFRHIYGKKLIALSVRSTSEVPWWVTLYVPQLWSKRRASRLGP